MSHPVFDRVNRLALQLRDNQTREKFELCEALASLLRNIASEDDITGHLEALDDNARLFRHSLRDIFQSQLSSDFRRKALNLTAALFECYGDYWLDSTPDTHILLVLMTNIACIEIRVSLCKRKAYKDIDQYAATVGLCSWLQIFQGSVHRLTNDPGDTKWEPNEIESLQKCYTQTAKDLCAFINLLLAGEEYETNRECRQFLNVAVAALTYWNLNDMDSLEDIMQPLLAKLAPMCHRMKWSQACLNIVARLDHETDVCDSQLVKQVWEPNESLMTCTVMSFCSQLSKMKSSQDRRLINVAHFLFIDFDSLNVADSRDQLHLMAKALAEWMVHRDHFGTFEAHALLVVACLVIKFCSVNVEDSDSYNVTVVCAIQVLWTFCGFNRNNKDNTFRMPSIYKKLEDELPTLIDIWCESMQVLSQLIRKNEFIARFLLKHKLPHRALTVPLMGTMEMPEPMDEALQEFQQTVMSVCPDTKDKLEALQEELLLSNEFHKM